MKNIAFIHHQRKILYLCTLTNVIRYERTVETYYI